MKPWFFVQLASIALIYLVLAKLGLRLASINPSVSPVWPASGFALAMVVLWGNRVWPAVFIAALIANATTAGSPVISAVIASGNTLEALAGGYLITRYCGGIRAFDTPVNVAKFALICIGSAALISATIGVLALQAGGFVGPRKFTFVWMTWWLGDCAGALLFTPVIILWMMTGPSSYNRKELTTTALLIAAASAVGFIVFTPLEGVAWSKAPMGFLAMLPLLWAGLYRGQRDTATVALVLASFAIWGAAGVNPSARTNINDAFMLVSMFVIGAALPSLALSAQVEVRRQGREKLRESEEQLRNVGDSLPDSAIYRYAIEAKGPPRFHYVSKGIEQLNGVSVEDALHDAGVVLRQILPEYLPQFAEAERRSGRDMSDFKMEVPMRRPDGEVRWMRLWSRPHRRQDGTVVWDGVQTDITDRKRHEEQIRLLLQEVNHRSKNMLAVVQAIARQTAATQPSDFVERFTDRIGALASSQDLLTQSEWNGVKLHDLIRSQLGHLADLTGTRIFIQGANKMINPAAAQSIGMAVHELATNAGKFGALSASGGRVEISWRIEPQQGAKATFAIKWHEIGGPEVHTPEGRGFGTAVITDIIESSLNGRATLAFEKSGLRWHFECPAAEVLEESGTPKVK